MSIFDKIFDINDQHKGIVGLTNELKCIYTYNLFMNDDKNILLVTSSLYEASQYYQNLTNYTKDVLLFPMDDFLTSEALAISPELKTTRLETLKSLNQSGKKIVITNLMGYLRYLPEKKIFDNCKIKLKVNDNFKIDDLVKKLFKYGYTRETVVNKTGEVAVRGFVVDIFPISEVDPIRIEYWGDTIDSIRTFDVNSQLTIKNIKEIEIDSNTEFLVDNDIDTFDIKHRELIDYGNVSNISDYLNGVTIFNDYHQLEISNKLLQEEIFNYNVSLNLDGNTKYMNDFYDIKSHDVIYFNTFDNEMKQISNMIYDAKEVEPFLGNTESINKKLDEYLKIKKQVIICLHDTYKVNKVIDELNNKNIIITNESNIIPNKINVIVKNINSGFIYNDLVVISERELFNKKDNNNIYKTNFKFGTKIRDLTKLAIGDYIVHSVHGIGIYCGIKSLLKNGLKKDYLLVEYKGSDKLYIPVEKIELISKYSSKDGMVPKINKLGSAEWAKTKLTARKRIRDIASELLKLYALREASEGFAFKSDTEEQYQFEDEFAYEETTDQLKVVEEIKKDMESSRPMDRILCGDVGYGKTEVAFRAMFKAIMSGKQVALLCPTTILSSQHYNNAMERFNSFPVNIALLNRFVTPKETKKIIKDVKEGKIDLLIGTHKILNDEIEFKDLGLLVIDEEQRFGVTHKEKIKKYKNNIDILTLSATPIPRTLQMSMAGIRSLSLIETPPVNRYPIQTYVLSENNQIIKDAIYKELSRNGQTFILYNKIEDMQSKLVEISSLVPDARVVAVHGQMPKSKLEDIMFRFINHEYDVLLCTTIIETGIDIPSVNTLIIINADYFGLSQLYQIRGRVGRSNKIAYCYLMYDKTKILSEVATKRLKAIKEFTELGSGFAIAMRDLSIRGAGDILGSEQAGFVDTIGVELFLEMLNNEINALKGNIIEEKEVSAQPLLDVETSIDDSYVAEEELKIEIHKKINGIDSYERLLETKSTLEDRFGKLSETLIIYMYQEWFEKLANRLNITNIKQTKNFIEITLDPNLTKKINGEFLFIETNRISRMFRLSLKNKRLVIILDTVKLEKHFIYYLIELIEIIEKSIVD
ncbi:MAG: transcription-repair coupling factor [Ignavibacteriales bacterium]